MMAGQPSLWDQTGGKVGHDHPQTSHTAARQFPGGPIVEETTTPGNSGQVQKLTDLGRSEAIRLRHAR